MTWTPDLEARARELLAAMDSPTHEAEDRGNSMAIELATIDAALGEGERVMRYGDTTRYIVMRIGCIECGVSSDIKGSYQTREEAEAREEALSIDPGTWYEGGQCDYQVFVVPAALGDL